MTRRSQRRLAVGVIAPALGGLIAYLFGLIGLAAYALGVVVLFGALETFVQDPDEPKVALRRSFWIGLLLPLGLTLLFIAERVIGGDHELIWAWRTLAFTCLGAVVAWRGFALLKASGNQRKVEISLLSATGGVLLALGLYALSTEWGVELMGFEESAAERMSGTLSVLWVVLLTVSLSTLFAMELAYRGMPVEEAIELRRVGAAAGTGLSLSLSLIFVASMGYVATERDVKRDLSYLKTTRPDEQTLRMVRSVDEPISVMLFYPEVNEVLDQVRPYFDELDRASENLSVEVRDHALAHDLAEQHRVRGNGFVLVLRGEGEGQQAESFEVGLELEAARSRLRTLDARFQQHFAQLTTRPREIYLTTGHRERSATRLEGDPPEQRLGELSSALERSNIESRNLGIAQGLADRVPEAARAVAVIGPREPFLPEEARSLLEYVRGGGRVVVFVDPDVDHGLEPLLSGLGLSLQEGVLHSRSQHVRRTRTEADLEIVFSNTYSAHPSVTMANRYRTRVATIFSRGGALARHENPAQLEGLSVTFALRADQGFWLDTDGDHDQDPTEVSERFNMIAAVTVPSAGGDEGRALIVADGDFITDAWIGNRGNAFVLMDTVNWLVGEEHVLGPTQTEEDISFEHTPEEDKLLFYGTSFGAPIPFLLMGIYLSTRKWRGGRKPGKKASAKGAPKKAREEEPPASSEEEE